MHNLYDNILKYCFHMLHCTCCRGVTLQHTLQQINDENVKEQSINSPCLRNHPVLSSESPWGVWINVRQALKEAFV